MTTRRQFLQRSGLLSLTPWIPAFLPQSLHATEGKRDERILVVIQLDGGNDGLNTVIPFADDEYAKSRTKLRVPENEVLKLNDTLGLHPAMKPAAELFEEGRLSIVQGVGYPNPNRSHFRSMAIWQHARLEEHEHDSIGWLGRAAETIRSADLATPDSIYVGEESIPVALRGRRANAVSLANENDMRLLHPIGPRNSALDTNDLTSFVTRTLDRSYDAARRFNETKASTQGEDVSYPSSSLARKLQLAARHIKLDGGTRVYYVSQPGYDTHTGQSNRHRGLLRDFSGALSAFLNDLRDSRLEDRVIVLAFSEFGRRVQENGSVGTDHGAAGPVFLAGSSIQGGFIGDHPRLNDLDAGDLEMSIDFRQIYATLIDQWLSINPETILDDSFDRLEFLKT